MTSSFWGPGRLVFGRGALGQLGKVVDQLGASTVLVVIDRNVARHPGVESALAALRDARNVNVHEHDGSEPSLAHATNAAQSAAPGTNVVIGIGGGSTLDTAKAVALARVIDAPLTAFEGADRIKVTPLPLIGIPTTAGTGSEVTGSCVLEDEQGKRKISLRSPRLRPQIAILDPSLLASVPKGVIRATGVDALAHAMEAYFSTGASVMTDRLALGAMSLIVKNLPPYYADPIDSAASDGMAWGSCMAGIAFNSARVGVAHAVASAIGPLTGLSHGMCVGLALPEAVRLNLSFRAADRSALLFHLGIANSGEDWEQAIRDRLAALYEQIDFPATARKTGRVFDVDDALIDRIIRSGRLETNPAPVGADTLREVLQAIRG